MFSYWTARDVTETLSTPTNTRLPLVTSTRLFLVSLLVYKFSQNKTYMYRGRWFSRRNWWKLGKLADSGFYLSKSKYVFDFDLKVGHTIPIFNTL